MKTLWTPASKNFLDIALFASGSGSLMSKNDLQIFRNSPLSWIVILIRRESASSHPLFRKISLIKASRSLQSTAGCLKFFESFVFLSSMWYVNRRISKKSSSWWFISLISLPVCDSIDFLLPVTTLISWERFLVAVLLGWRSWDIPIMSSFFYITFIT